MPSPVETSSNISSSTPLTKPECEGYRSLFRNNSFMALWIGQVFSQLADRIIFVVFVTLIVAHFGTLGSLKSMLYVAFTIPAILLTAAAGVFVDRWHRRRTLVMTNLLRAVIVAFIPLAVQANSLLALYACAFGISTVTQFFVPAESATIPMITRSSQLLVANSLFTTTMMGAVIFGFVLGDPLISLFGLQEVHWAIVGLFLLSALALSFVHAGHPGKTKPEQDRTTKQAFNSAIHEFWEEMKEGIFYLRDNTIILHKIIKLAILFSTVVAMCIIFISFAEYYLYSDPKIAAQKFSWIIAFSGVGMVAGALVIGRFLRHVARAKLVYGGFLVIGTGLLALMLTPVLSKTSIMPDVFPYLDWRVLYSHGVAVFLGLGAAMVAIPLQAVLHELIPEDKRGKIMGAQFTLLSACSTFPAVIAGVGSDFLGVGAMLAILGIPLLILGAKGLYDRIYKYNSALTGIGDDASTW